MNTIALRITFIAFLSVTTGWAQTKKPVAPTQTLVQQTQSPAPRFQLIQISEFRADQFLLDTQTGRLWQIVATKEGDKVLQRVMFIHGADEFRAELPESESEIQTSIAARKAWLKKFNEQKLSEPKQ
jgi:hypothetical protein